MDEAVARQRRFELHAQLVHVDVDRAVAVAQLPAPDLRVQVGPRDDPVRAARQRDEQLELADGKREGPAGGEAQSARRADLQIADLEDLVGFEPCRLHRGGQLLRGCGSGSYPVVKQS